MTRRLQTRMAPTFMLAGLISAGILATACDLDATPDQYAAVCIDRVTQIRVPDSQCGMYDTGAAVMADDEWDYIDTTLYPTFYLPRQGTRINITNVTVVHTVPASTVVYRSVPAGGGAFSSVKARTSQTTVGATNTGTGTARTASAAGQGTTNSRVQRGGFGIPSSSGGNSHAGTVPARTSGS